jgi:RimJ/RimL family protein N-acetyltransferase
MLNGSAFPKASSFLRPRLCLGYAADEVHQHQPAAAGTAPVGTHFTAYKPRPFGARTKHGLAWDLADGFAYLEGKNCETVMPISRAWSGSLATERSMTDLTPINLESSRLILRNFADSDLPAFLCYRNDPEVARYQSWESISEADAYAFIQEQKKLRPGIAGQWFQFAIEIKETGVLAGDCALRVNELDVRQGEIGFTISRENQRNGFGTEAVRRMLDYTFMVLGLHRVIAITDSHNKPSANLLERLGMRREGHFIQNVWFKGKWGDEFWYAVLKDEWHRLRELDRPVQLA